MSGPTPSSSRNPQIIVAVIGAVTTLGAALITALSSVISNSSPPAPTSTPLIVTSTPVMIGSTPAPAGVTLVASPSPLPLGRLSCSPMSRRQVTQ